MKIISLSCLLVLALILAFSTPSPAQYGHMGEGQMKMWNLKVGAFFPSNEGDLDTTFNVGIEHEHPAGEIIKGMSGNLTLSVDYARLDTTTTTGSDKVTLVPIFVNWKHHTMIGDTGRSWFWGLGLGTYWAFDEIPDMDLDNGLNFAYDLALGYNINPSWFVEGRFMAGQNPSEDRIFVVDLGYSF